MQIFYKKRFYFLVAIIGLVLLANSCVTLRKTDKQVYKSFQKVQQEAAIYYTLFDQKKMRYITNKPFKKKLPIILFVHGAPGSSSDFYKYLQDTDLQKKANLISVDRLGYGFSDYGTTEISIKKQAEAINNIANLYKKSKIILVGWSYGGPIIAKMAMDNNLYTQLVLLAPAISPKDEKYFWFGNFAKWKATKWFVPKPFVVAENEKLAHAKELKKIASNWKNIKIPITYFHGDKDRLVPYKNMQFIQKKVADSLLKCITLKGRNHFIPFSEYNKIKSELLSILDNLD